MSCRRDHCAVNETEKTKLKSLDKSYTLLKNLSLQMCKMTIMRYKGNVTVRTNLELHI